MLHFLKLREFRLSNMDPFRRDITVNGCVAAVMSAMRRAGTLASDPINFEQEWDMIRNRLTIFSTKFDSEDYMFVYKKIYDICTQERPHDWNVRLYYKFKEFLESYCTYEVLPAIKSRHGEKMLREYCSRWDDFRNLARKLNHLLSYLNRQLVGTRLVDLILDFQIVGADVFLNLVHMKIHYKTFDAACLMMKEEREGNGLDKYLIDKFSRCIIALPCEGNILYEEFEEAVLKNITFYYHMKSCDWIREYTFLEYILKVLICLRQERKRLDENLLLITHETLLNKLMELQDLLLSEDALVLSKKEGSGLMYLFFEGKEEELSTLSELCKDHFSVKFIADSFMECLTPICESLLKEAKDEVGIFFGKSQALVKKEDAERVLLQKVIELSTNYLPNLYFVRQCFDDHHFYRKAIHYASEVFFTVDISRSSVAELLTRMCNDILKKGNLTRITSSNLMDREDEIFTDEERQTIDKVVMIVSLLSDIDDFIEFYSRELARRLLEKKNGDPREIYVLEMITEQYGVQATHKMRRMYDEWIVANKNQNIFEEYLHYKPEENPEIGFNATVLTRSLWPIYQSNLNLPAEMKKCLDRFEKFYHTKHDRRKLTWIYSTGECNIAASFDAQTIELIVTAYQASVLQLFNTSDRLSFLEIQTELNVEDMDLIKILHSLSCAEYNILTKEPNSKTISRMDFFEFNSKFTHTRTERKIPLLLTEEERWDEKTRIFEVINQNKTSEIDAMIMKVMKNHKVLTHQQLAKCIIELSKTFQPDEETIKKRIESLIEQRYMRRDELNDGEYWYVP